MIDSIIKDGTVSHIQLTLSDYAQSPGYLILKSFAIKHATAKKNKVHVLCYEAGGRDLNLGPEVEVHACFQDPLGWISGKEDQTSFSLLSDLERHIGKTDEEVIVIVDSLNCLLYNSDLCRDINKISKQQGPVKVKQLICIIHEDGVSTEVKCGLKSLIHMSRTHIDMLEDGKISIVHKKNSGKILSEVNKIWWNPQLNSVESSPVQALDYLMKPPPSSTDEPMSTFNLSLTDSEKLAKDQLVLPYVNSATSGGGAIYIEPEDYDEEDPDDDLDV